ncbi:flagellar hook-associated protein FlgL [Marinomonas sp. C2222]|uniref:Flagellar hook-associated protein FlgL n=1 Tax=Marinomonas sargassi TaxID=2984494 RepID=A0ABT2YNM9_9GAMM|nr:flagellar hook-associated protein FlgL [Marinomonas sargassi]MCV2401500.1 flagellar hook-associated protein FlgL [Marinomonas sargassi]
MRVTNNLIYGQSNRSISQANEKILGIQEKVSGQTGIVRPSDDPVGASQLLMYKGSTDQLRLYDDAMKMATSNLEYQEVALDSLNDSMDEAKTLFIQAQNDINTQDDLDAIVQEIGMITDSMAELMNARGADGSYVFAGTDTLGPAFVLNSNGRYEWAGNEGQKLAQISEHIKIPVTDSGKKLFQDVWTNLSFSSDVLAGNISLTAKVKDSGDFGKFMDDHYDPENIANNAYVLTTLPILAEGEEFQLEELIDDINFGESEDISEMRDYWRSFDGTPGTYSIKNSAGEEIASGYYKAGQPITFSGMQFIARGEPGAVVGLSLDKPRRENVLNEIKDVLDVLGNDSSTHEQKAQAFADVTASLDNAQRMVLEGRSAVGARLNTLRDREDFSSANQLSNAVARDRIGGLDVAAAATELSMKESALDASQKVFSRISNLSLFNKI